MQPGIIFIYSLGKEFETFSALSTRRFSDWPMGWLSTWCHFRTNHPNNNRRQLGLASSLSSAPIIIITQELDLAWPSFTEIKTSRGSENDISHVTTDGSVRSRDVWIYRTAYAESPRLLRVHADFQRLQGRKIVPDPVTWPPMEPANGQSNINSWSVGGQKLEARKGVKGL